MRPLFFPGRRRRARPGCGRTDHANSSAITLAGFRGIRGSVRSPRRPCPHSLPSSPRRTMREPRIGQAGMPGSAPWPALAAARGAGDESRRSHRPVHGVLEGYADRLRQRSVPRGRPRATTKTTRWTLVTRGVNKKHDQESVAHLLPFRRGPSVRGRERRLPLSPAGEGHAT